MAEKLSPVAFMHKFMKLLSQDYQEQQNKLDLTLEAMTTGIDSKAVIDNANELKNAIKADISSILQNGTAKDFLKQKCNIDLDNEDTGSLLGFDCSGGDILNDADVVKEEGEIKNHPASAVINGCTLTFTNYSDTKRKFVMNGLYTWWIPLAFDKIKEGYGLEYTEDSFVRQMPISLYDKPSQNGLTEGANVTTTFLIDTGVATAQTLNINMNDAAYGTIIIGDKSGATELKKFGSLDRTLLHELTHALMGTNIQWFSDLPLWFQEGGTAVLLEGADDTRQAHILNAVSDTTIIDNGFSDSPVNTNEYSVGFLAMRYLLANYADRQQKITFESNPLEPFEIMWQKNAHGIKSEFCISRDGDLNKIMNEFSDFVQRDDYNEVQPWDLIRDNNIGKTFRIPMKDYTETEEDIVADFIGIYGLYSVDYVGLPINMCYNCSIPTISISNVTYESALSLKWNPNNSQFPLQDVASMYNNVKGIIGEGRWYPFDSILLEFFGCSLDIIPNSLYRDIYNILDFNLQYDEGVEESFARITGRTAKAHLFLTVVDILYPNIDTSLDDISFRRSFCRVTEDMKNTAEFLESLGALIIDARPNILDELESLIKNNDRFSVMSDMSLAEAYVFAESSDFAYRDYWHGCKRNATTHTKVSKYNLSQYSETFPFVVTETENKKFPCFYLSTGVFKPKDWVNEGLKYPEHVIKQENQNDEYIPFNIHVLYDKNMRFDLQGQGTAKRTTGAEGNAYILDGVEGNPDTGYYPVESDAIPGIGCPMIVCSQENKITYPYIECYFTKTNYSGTVTLIFYSADNEAQNPVFQSVAFGLGKSEESSYKYPLYTAGGSCGLYPYGYTFTWTDTGRPPTTHTLYIGGQKINFDMSKGESLSSLLYPCGIEKSNISNVRIMQPDGRWVSAKNFMQTQETMNGTCGSMLTKSDIESSTLPMIYPTISDIDNVDRFTFTQPVMVIRKRVDEEDESGFTLAFDGVKAKADRLRAIFTAKDGHEYLSVPNGWYSRTFGIPYTSGATESGENILDVIARLNKNMPKQNYVLTIDLG